jgi:hypothetical protein
MTTLEPPALAIGLFVGAVTAMTQEPAQLGVLSFLSSPPILSGIISAAVAYGVMKTTVKVLERDTQEMRADLKGIATRLARIEGKLEAEP